MAWPYDDLQLFVKANTTSSLSHLLSTISLRKKATPKATAVHYERQRD